MPPTIFDPSARRAFVARLEQLAPDRPRRWGTMSAAEAVPHLGDQIRLSLGEIEAPVTPGPMTLAPVRRLIIYWMPWPRGRVKAPPVAFTTSPTDFETDVVRTRELIERLGAHDPSGDWPKHPLFGPLTGRDWGVFTCRHLEHHLTQFGV